MGKWNIFVGSIYSLGVSENIPDGKFWILKDNSYCTRNGVNGSNVGTKDPLLLFLSFLDLLIFATKRSQALKDFPGSSFEE